MRSPTPLTKARIISTIKKYRLDLKENGIISLNRIVLDILDKFKRLFFSIDKFYLYKYNLVNSTDIPNIQPKVENISICAFFSRMPMEEFEALIETGYDFRKHPSISEYKNGESGIVIFCGLVGDKLAYQACAATYRTGVYRFVCSSEYDLKKVAYQGLNVTTHEFRRKGLYTWGQCEMLKFFRDHGFQEMVMLEAERLEDMRRIQDRIGAEVLYESYCLRVLFFFNYRWNKPSLS